MMQPPPMPPAPYYGPASYALVPAVPKPRGVPSRSPFLVGATGHFFAAAMCIVYGIAVLLLSFFFYFGLSLIGLILEVILFVALVLHLVGFYGLWRNYGSGMAGATFAYGLVASIFFMVASVLSMFAYQYLCYGYNCYPTLSFWGLILVLVSYVMLGVMFILEGVAFLVVRRFTSLPGAAIAAGVLFIIGGSFVTSILLAFYGGFFVLAPALIIGGVVLVKSPVPGLGAYPPGVPQYGMAPPGAM